MSSPTVVQRFEYDGWHVVIELEEKTPKGEFSGHADLRRKGEQSRRIDLVGNYESIASAMRPLAGMARDFIDEWDIERANLASPFIDR